MPARTLPLTEFLPATASEYYRRWLQRNQATHGVSAVTAFLREHPFMFGSQIGVIAGGYSLWVQRSGVKDGPEAFGEYISDRYKRWRAGRIEARQGHHRIQSKKSAQLRNGGRYGSPASEDTLLAVDPVARSRGASVPGPLGNPRGSRPPARSGYGSDELGEA